MFELSFLKDALERAVRSFAGAYTAVGAFVADDFWSKESLEGALGAAAFSFLLAFATQGVGSDKGSASVL